MANFASFTLACFVLVSCAVADSPANDVPVADYPANDVPTPPATPPPTTTAAATTTAAPLSMPTQVVTTMTLIGLDFDGMLAQGGLEVLMKHQIANAYLLWVGDGMFGPPIVPPTVKLTSGSVLTLFGQPGLNAEIDATFGAASTASAVSSASTYSELSDKVVTSLNRLPRIAAIGGLTASVAKAQGAPHLCFAGESAVTVHGYGTKSMDSLRLADKILVEGQKYEPVIGFLHAASHITAAESFRSASFASI